VVSVAPKNLVELIPEIEGNTSRYQGASNEKRARQLWYVTKKVDRDLVSAEQHVRAVRPYAEDKRGIEDEIVGIVVRLAHLRDHLRSTIT